MIWPRWHNITPGIKFPSFIFSGDTPETPLPLTLCGLLLVFPQTLFWISSDPDTSAGGHIQRSASGLFPTRPVLLTLNCSYTAQKVCPTQCTQRMGWGFWRNTELTNHNRQEHTVHRRLSSTSKTCLFSSNAINEVHVVSSLTKPDKFCTRFLLPKAFGLWISHNKQLHNHNILPAP